MNSSPTQATEQLERYLQDEGIEFVRVIWCDNANVIRAKAVHISALDQHATRGVGISVGQQALAVTQDVVIPETGLSPVGEAWLVPDWGTLSALPYSLGHGRVMGDMVRAGEPWALCPRHFLRRMIARAADAGLDFDAAFENEFTLMRQTAEGLEPADDTPFASTRGMDLSHDVIQVVTSSLIAQGLCVERYHPESGPGQHEISVRHTDALAAADHQIVFRETVHAVAARNNLTATFAPSLSVDGAGNGCHIHWSLRTHGADPGDPASSLVGDRDGGDRLSKTAEYFVAGILQHLPALMGITTPSTNSYKRIRPYVWSGAYRVWGYDNREAAVRVPTDPEGPPQHVELKTADATANPYLALGALLACGLDGIARQLPLAPPTQRDPSTLSDDERKEAGIAPLPKSLDEALGHLEADAVLLEALGEPLSKAYRAVKRTEWEQMKDLSHAEEVHLILERY